MVYSGVAAEPGPELRCVRDTLLTEARMMRRGAFLAAAGLLVFGGHVGVRGSATQKGRPRHVAVGTHVARRGDAGPQIGGQVLPGGDHRRFGGLRHQPGGDLSGP